MAIWTTKDGRTIKICDMTDSHLLNAHRFLCKRLDTLCDIEDRIASGDEDVRRLRIDTDTVALHFILKVDELADEISDRGLRRLAEMRDHPYLNEIRNLNEIRRDWEAAEYEAYCAERGIPCRSRMMGTSFKEESDVQGK